MNRYPQYKDSGISWLGEVPAHWDRVRYKDILSPKDIRVGNDTSYTLLSLTKQGVIVRDLTEGKGKFPKDFETYKVVAPNDFILCLFDVDETPRTVGVAHNKGMITGAYDIFNVKRANLSWVYYHYLSLDDKKCLKPLYRGLRKTIPLPRLLSSHIFVPPQEEQQAIVDFLDQATAKIDDYIALKETEIEKLGLLKQSIISAVVTHGLDSNVPMKESGIPWLSNIPTHWKRIRSKNLFTKMNRPVDSDDEVITCFRDGQVTLRRNRRTEGFTESFKEIGYQGIRPGDLVIHQMDAFAGAIGVSDSKGKGTPVYICLQPKKGIINWYYAYLLREMARTGYIKSLYRGIRERSSDFRFETFSKLFLPVPPFEEQQAIVDFLDRKIQEINGFIENIRKQIDKLKIYKQRLISDAVTGKIDVRTDSIQEGA